MTEEQLNNPHKVLTTALLDISVIITSKNGKPAIELRRLTEDPETIKKLVSCAYHSQPIILMPKFTDTTRSIASLVEKGVLYYDNGYFFNI